MGSIRKTGCFQFVSFRTENESNSSISIGDDPKVGSISILLLREGGVVEDRGGRRNNVCSFFIENDRVMYSPTTSPYGYSSFPKEEI